MMSNGILVYICCRIEHAPALTTWLCVVTLARWSALDLSCHPLRCRISPLELVAFQSVLSFFHQFAHPCCQRPSLSSALIFSSSFSIFPLVSLLPLVFYVSFYVSSEFPFCLTDVRTSAFISVLILVSAASTLWRAFLVLHVLKI